MSPEGSPKGTRVPAVPSGTAKGPGALERVGLRAGIAIVVAVGTLLVVTRSVLYAQAPAIPYGLFSDARPVLVLGLVGGLAFAGAFLAGARSATVWTVVLLVLVFELDEATVHWFSSFPGTLSGARLDPVRLLGGGLAIGGALLLHADVSASEAAGDLEKRGVPADEARAAGNALADLGRRRVATLLAGLAGAGAIVYAGDAMFGESKVGPGEAGLAVGVAALAVVALVVLLRPRST